MKRLFIFSLLLVCMISISYAQDVIYFIDGSTLEGEILEMDPASSLKIKTIDGDTFVVKMSDVDHTAKLGSGTSKPGRYAKKQIDRHGKELYWVSNGQKLTFQDYDNELKGDLLTTFRSAQKQFSSGNSCLVGAAILGVTAILFTTSYTSTVYIDSNGIVHGDDSKYACAMLTAIGCDAFLALGCIFRGIGKGRMEWVKDTYNNSSRNTAAKVGLSPSLMMTAQRDLGLGATLSFSF